jgi:tetratricopeptide (TPR) repeat protein
VREYSTREVAELSGLPEDRIRRWTRDGLLAPGRDALGRWRYSFQDLALVRTAAELLGAGLTPRRVTRALRLLREQLPPGRPLSAVRILVSGQRVIVRDRLSSWEPESRQGTFDFDVRALSQQVAPPRAPHSRPEPRSTGSAADLYRSAIDLELAGRGAEAREAYQAALQRDPKLASAWINLGRLLHADKRIAEAEAHYRAALEQDPRNALAAFNLGVALEDRGEINAAVEAYSRALSVDENYADAHFNLSRLLEARGDERGALRHLSRFRRLMRGES